MGGHRRAPAGVALILAGVALITVGPGASLAGSTPTAGVNGASGSKLVRFFRPTGDTLVQMGTGPIRVIVQLGAGARLTNVDVDGVVVTRLLRPGPGGYYGASLSLGRHLHYGFNDAFAQATGRDGSRATAHVRFIVAKRDDSLLRLTSFSTQTTAAPLQVGLREVPGTNVRAALSAAQGVSARVYVNDRRVDRGFSLQGGRLSVRLGAGEGLRFGRNRIQILVHKTHPYKRESSYDLESRTVYIGRHAPIASAGADQTITGDGSVRFDGRATKLPPGWTRPSFRWRIVSAPKGSKARLRNASGSRPTMVPDRPGVYDVRVSVRGTPPRVSSGLGARDAAATDASNDTTTATKQRDIPPAGVRLETREGSVQLDGQPVPNAIPCCNSVNYAVLDRQTLELTASGSVNADVAGMEKLSAIIDRYTGSLDHLVVLNWYAPSEQPLDVNEFDKLLKEIGGRRLADAQRLSGIHVSAVGVAGAPAGSAFVTVNNAQVGLSGSLRLNGVTGKYDFVFTDPVDFDTETNQAGANASPAQLTIQVGEKRYTQPNPGGGVSGFHLLVLSADRLNPVSSYGESVYVTNAADGAEQPAAVQKLASELSFAVDDPSRPLVFLQAFGAPHGNDVNWDNAAKQIERLGGTRQVFNALNAVDPRPLNGDDSNRKGRYAFVGRVGETAPMAEASYSLNALPGRLQGVLMRARDGGFEPMIAGPPRSDGESPVNTQLIHIANQAPQPFPAFRDANGQPIGAASAQAVQNFLGGAQVTGLCSAAVTVCEIRESYYESYGTNWSSTQDDLTNAKDKCSQPHQGFTAAECEGIRVQLRDEVSMVARVKEYFGPLGLQQPFGASGVSALANLTQISQEIQDKVQPPPADNTTSNTLSMIGQILFPTPTTPNPGVFSALSAAFSVAGYFTRENGSPNLIGPQVRTAASKLGVELADRYQQAGQNLNDVGRLIVSDYGKLTAVANKVDAKPGPGEPDWRLGNVGQAQDGLERAAQQTIYESLVPLAYPVMYDLGERISNARDWYCDGGPAPFGGTNKRLFNEQPDGAQFVGRFPSPDPRYPWNPIIAVAQAQAVGQSADARIRGIPASITDKLFKPDELGLNKLEFFSPRNGFRYLPAQPGVPTLVDERGVTLPGLIEFPYNTSDFPNARIQCDDIPDPPGNSG